jgi:hypothetical protein
MSDWWRAVDDELARRSDEAPDPWAGRLASLEVRLTDEQVRFLAQLADLPVVFLELDDLPTDDLPPTDPAAG